MFRTRADRRSALNAYSAFGFSWVLGRERPHAVSVSEYDFSQTPMRLIRRPGARIVAGIFEIVAERKGAR